MRIGPIVLLLAIGFGLFSATGRDDSYITYWAAHTLADRGAIVNYNGERVEQSSSLAHVVVLATLRTLTGIDPARLGVFVSIVFGCWSVWLTARLAERIAPALGAPAGWLAGSTGALIYWSFGGLETTLAACCYAWLALTYERALREGFSVPGLAGAVVATSACLMARPEAILLLTLVTGGLVTVLASSRSMESSRVRRALSFALLVGILGTLLLIWRHWYFGAWFPQPVSAKVATRPLSAVPRGVGYLARAWARVDVAIWIVAVVGIVGEVGRVLRRRPRSPAVLIPELFLSIGLLLIVGGGGDWMEGSRFLVPFLPMAIAITLATIERWTSRSLIVGAIVAAQLVGAFLLARYESPGGPPWATAHLRNVDMSRASWFERMQRIHVRDLVFTDRLLNVVQRLEPTPDRPVRLMADQMGLPAQRIALADFGSVRFTDMFALTTRDFTDCPVTAVVPRSSIGVLMSYDFVFAHRDELRQVCGLDDPDVIFGLDRPDWRAANVVAAHGYDIVYRQDGDLTNGSRWLPGAAVAGEAFIAVRHDRSAGLSYPTVHFNEPRGAPPRQ